jgi:hypothetical protein
MSDLLNRISTGAIERPVSVIVHGSPGVGKSTFAAGAPKPFFIDCDNRTAHLDVKRIKPESWEDVLGVFRLVAKGELECSTLVVDTLDHAEILMHRDLCKAHEVSTIEEVGGGYGKGYVAALGEWRRFGVAMDAIRARGVGLVLLAHSQVKVFQNPSGENYERFELKLDKRAHNFLRERVDGVGYASFATTVVKGKDDKFKAKSSGKATLTFAPSAAVETKRFSKFPLNCDLNWTDFTTRHTETK